MEEEDGWNFSAEELDSMEQTAKRQIAERGSMASSSSSASHHLDFSPSKRRLLPGSFQYSPSKGGYYGRPIHVKIFQDRPGRIALETQYNQALVATLKTIPGHEWDQIRKVWTYPEDKLESLGLAITSLSTVTVNVDIVPPLHLSRLQGSFQCSSTDPEAKTMHSSQGNSPISRSPMAMAKRSSTITVQLFLMNPDLIAARNPYHENIKEACQSVSGRAWNTGERVWTFPKSSLGELVQALRKVQNPSVTIEATPPLSLSEDLDRTGIETSRCSQIDGGIPKVCLWPPPEKQPNAQSESQDFSSKTINLSVKLTLHSSGKVAAKFDYEPRLVAVVKSVPGAEWNSRERVWVFPPSSLCELDTKLSNINGMSVKLENLEPMVRRSLELSASLPDLRERYCKIPVELEKRLLPFQRDGVQFALQHGGRLLIADEMGLGKTLQAIAFTACFPDEWPVLIISPSSLRLHWATMLTHWLDIPPGEVLVVMSQYCGSNREGFNILQTSGRKSVRLDGLFNIISYDLVTKLQEDITQADFKIVIADEAHYLKNAQAKRTTACVPLLQKSKYALLLTGTPALSRPIELYKQLEALQPAAYKNVHEYGKRYCMGGHFGVYQGASNCEELHALMKSTIMVRRLKKDVLSELPLKRRQQIFLSLDEKGLKQMRALFYELESLKREIKCSTSQEDADKMRYLERQLISKIYTESAEVKLPAVEDYLSTIIEADCKFLIFAHHKILLDGIEKFLAKKKLQYIRIDGKTEASTRQRLVNTFQETDNVKAAVLGIRAAGVGLNLTAASMVIFAEMSWTPGDLVQAEDRAHRIGQVTSVNVYYLHAHDTVDDLIWESVQHKLENIGQVLDGKEDTLHIAATERHKCLPAGQSTLKEFLIPCSSNLQNNSDKVDTQEECRKKRKVNSFGEHIQEGVVDQ